jgi:DNA-binding transcriptional regulator YiaG
MPTVRRSYKDIKKGSGRIDLAKIDSFTKADIERFMREDDSDTREMGEPRWVPAITAVRALRERLGISRAEFAQRFLLSVRTVQHWEQQEREPSEPARILLYAIARSAVPRLRFAPLGMTTGAPSLW